MIRCQADLFTQCVNRIGFGFHFAPQCFDLFIQAVQLRFLLFSLKLLLIQLMTAIFQFLNAAARAPVGTVLGAVFPQLFFCGVIIVQIVCIVHQIAQLGADRGRGLHFAALLQLRHIGAAGKRLCIQLKQFLAQFFRKA